MRLRLLAGGECELGERIGTGGEGSVYRLAGQPQRVAKIYLKPPAQLTVDKLHAMVRLGSDTLRAVAAWPTDLILDRTSCVGFLMPFVSDASLIDHLSHPAERRRRNHQIDYAFLSTVARNVMDAAASLHAAGVMIGDVNESNVVVRRDATVCFIDADSFQVSVDGRTYMCGVGKDMYTPPELLGLNLGQQVRTANQDCFSLAILVFQLLMHGRHPFHGRPLDGVDRDTMAAIRAGAYAYSIPSNGMIGPPPGAMEVSALGELGQHFERAFRSQYRPSAKEWVDALERLRATSRSCPRNKRHAMFGASRECAICKLPHDPLPDVGGPGPADSSATTSTVEQIIRDLRGIVEPMPIASRVREPSLTAEEQRVPAPAAVQPRTSAAVKKRAVEGADSTIGWGIGIGVCSGMVALLFMQPACALGVLVGICTIIAGVSRKSEANSWQTEPIIDLSVEKARTALGNSLTELRLFEASAREEERQLIAEVSQRRREAGQLADRLEYLVRQRAKAPTQAEAEFRQEWIHEQLEGYVLEDGTVEGIGKERCRVLASFGYETAADVSGEIAYAVPGFGAILTARLMQWRENCARIVTRQGVPPMPMDYLDRVKARQLNDVLKEAQVARKLIEPARERATNCERRLSSLANEVDRRRASVRQQRRATRP